MPFQPGVSGNPAGRPRGSRNKSLRLVESLLDDGAAEVVQAVLHAARNGDVAACRVVLERVLPVMREKPIELLLPPTKTAQGISDAAECVVEAVADGSISIGEGKSLMTILETRRKALETVELETRIAALEASLK